MSKIATGTIVLTRHAEIMRSPYVTEQNLEVARDFWTGAMSGVSA
jgi:hypothetical protein